MASNETVFPYNTIRFIQVLASSVNDLDMIRSCYKASARCRRRSPPSLGLGATTIVHSETGSCLIPNAIVLGRDL